MDELNKIIDRYTEGNYLIGKTAKEEMAKDILALFNVSQRYSIEDIERCVENWGLCKVEKEYIEKFLNDCKRLNN